MNKQSTALKIVQNPLEEYKTICEQIKNLETIKENLKKTIFNMMDEDQSDLTSYEGYSAKRELVVRNQINLELLKEELGPKLPSFYKEGSYVKLSVQAL